MAAIKVTPEDIKTLEIKADIAYNTLRDAVKARDEVERAALISSAESLYSGDLGNYLEKLAVKATNNLRRLNKGGKRARKLERFILQYVLMTSTADRISEPLVILGDTRDGMGGLKAYIHAQDDGNTPEGKVFRQLQHRATSLRESGRYDLILKALEYVRARYKSKDL